LRLLKGLIFFGKRDLAIGINLPERSEIWKTFWGSLMALTVDMQLAAMRTVRALHLHCRRIVLPQSSIFRRTVCLPGRAIAGFYRGNDTGKRVRSRE